VTRYITRHSRIIPYYYPSLLCFILEDYPLINTKVPIYYLGIDRWRNKENKRSTTYIVDYLSCLFRQHRLKFQVDMINNWCPNQNINYPLLAYTSGVKSVFVSIERIIILRNIRKTIIISRGKSLDVECSLIHF
jgi:hypothetical protein